MKVLVIGAVDFSLHCLNILNQAGADIVGVVSTEQPERYSDYADMEPLCCQHGWPFQRVTDINSPVTLDWIGQRQPDVIFCLGWSQLIKTSLLAQPPLGVIGAHPSLLPHNRGRHPLIWALVLGLEKTGLSFFQMNEGADTGDILAQSEIPIGADDNAEDLYEKVKVTAVPLLTELFQALAEGRVQPLPQAASCGNHWRKRSKVDGQIDWRMSTKAIHNLVRALHRPYPGATASYGQTEFVVWQVENVDWPDAEYEIEYHEPGKILALRDGKPIVKTYDGVLKLKQIEPELDFTPDTYMD
ncbi:methionyl-tRNA formyltransferase [Hydrogenovibrio thermophilus]|uniref:Methionyl-tRNA formyltransferase n=1 Tax=Hydrogenovibrio thermophilus TaxID=265883 RepID=A0A410H3V3_9GAMM|nr:methionyl-tRNA formyltransferase [Hydrogenovibrio thermophilus]QAB15581.1 methionyl-tRNA formyltransferase [Hydrogenovibrio thermophilus]